MSHQPPLIPFVCGFKGCDKDAVCGLRNKSHGFVVNVCEEHFRVMKERDFTDEDRRSMAVSFGDMAFAARRVDVGTLTLADN